MDNTTTQEQSLVSLVIIALVIAVILLLGVIGYAYLTKDITPKNMIVKFFSSKNLTFEDLPESEKNRYVLKSNSLKVLNPSELEEEQTSVEVTADVVEDSVPNKFLNKMATMQKDTGEMVIEDISTQLLEESDTTKRLKETKPQNKFLEKMATMQKETDKMVIEGKTEIVLEKEDTAKNRFLEKMATMQKETDEMIIKNNGN